MRSPPFALLLLAALTVAAACTSTTPTTPPVTPPPSSTEAPSEGLPTPSGRAPTEAPTATPTGTESAAPGAFHLGCLSIEAAECESLAIEIARALPPDRGVPFAIEIQLYGCDADPNCPRSLAARPGNATIEYLDGGEPVRLALAGTPDEPEIGPEDFTWLGPSTPSSARVSGAGPHPYVTGHCGLMWRIDFDGSYWLPVGQVDGDAPAIIGDEEGAIVLLGQDEAEYRGENGFVAQLVRFPGPKHVWGCR